MLIAVNNVDIKALYLIAENHSLAICPICILAVVSDPILHSGIAVILQTTPLFKLGLMPQKKSGGLRTPAFTHVNRQARYSRSISSYLSFTYKEKYLQN